MAITLTSNIDATQTTFRVTGTVPADIGTGYLFRIGDEVLRLRGFEGVLPPFPVPVDRNHWRAERAYGETVAAAHAATTAVLGARDAYTSSDDEDQPSPFPAGGALGATNPVPADGTIDGSAEAKITFGSDGTISITAGLSGGTVNVNPDGSVELLGPLGGRVKVSGGGEVSLQAKDGGSITLTDGTGAVTITGTTLTFNGADVATV